MVSLFQVSSEKQAKDSDVARKRVPNEVEDSEVARKRRVGNNKEIIVIDEDSDSDSDSGSHSPSSMIMAMRRRMKVDTTCSTSFKGVVRPRKDYCGSLRKCECGSNFFCKKLFEKELTPDDVGSPNQLVIPEKFAAMMHLHGTVHQQGGGGGNDQSTDTEIVYYDRLNTEWKFRWRYWKSSQRFACIRGWNALMKAKNLKAKDTLLFFTCQCPSDKTSTTTTLIPTFGIDVQHYNGFNENGQRGLRLFGVQII